MSASEALTIWILSTAMKAPSVAPVTASQVFAEIAGGAAGNGLALAGTASLVACSVVMVVSPRARDDASVGCRAGVARCEPFLIGETLGDSSRFRIDGRLSRHARPQAAVQTRIVEDDLDRHALHDLGEV